MSNYYYLTASLPLLLFYHNEPLLRYKDFLNDCQRLLTKKDYYQVHATSLNTDILLEEGTGTLQKWQKINIAIRNYLVKYRAKQLGISPEPYLRIGFNEIPFAEHLGAVLEEGSPLKIEIHLMEFQWRILDDLEAEHQFDLDFLIIYSLKLQILERKMSFNKENGKIRLHAILKQEYD